MGCCEEIIWPRGLKKTEQRLKIVETLCESVRPLNVQEISALLEKRGAPMWPSTIYRVLDTLIEHRIIQKADVGDGGMAVYEFGDSHRHYAVCLDCRQATEIHGCPLDGFTPELQDKKFHVSGHKLQISGYCEECYSKRQHQSDAGIDRSAQTP